MKLSELQGPLSGRADAGLEEVVARLDRLLSADPDLSFQVAAYVNGQLALDAYGGPHLGRDSLIVPYSTSKNIIGVSVGLLVERGLLDLDATVASHWPEFAQAGKERVTVRQLLSHQAGLPEAQPRLTWGELLDHHKGAERLAATQPLWHPGSAFGYHGLTIGNLAAELVFRITGRTPSSSRSRASSWRGADRAASATTARAARWAASTRTRVWPSATRWPGARGRAARIRGPSRWRGRSGTWWDDPGPGGVIGRRPIVAARPPSLPRGLRQRRIRVISGSNSGSAAVVAATRSPK